MKVNMLNRSEFKKKIEGLCNLTGITIDSQGFLEIYFYYQGTSIRQTMYVIQMRMG